MLRTKMVGRIAAGVFAAGMLWMPARAQMTTPGQFQVSETGAATYSIPIQVPPGVAGIEPKLSLNYSSQAGNGLLGVGWSLGGLGGIARCPRTLAQDNVRGSVSYDANDRYCLDGQRLIAISGGDGADGTEYRTERESFARVVSYGTAGNGPAWFKVWTKSGLVMSYGATTDSRLEVQGKSSIRIWGLNRIEDSSGNYLTAVYEKNAQNGTSVVSMVEYGGNRTQAAALNSVQFQYDENRPDTWARYDNGATIKETKRLTGMQVFTGKVLVRSYSLDYQTSPMTSQSTLIKATECDGKQVCLPPIDFAWLGAAPNSFDAWSSSGKIVSRSEFSISNCRSLIAADVNGDGLTDLVCLYDYGNAVAATYVQLSQGSTFSAWQTWSAPTAPGGLDLNSCKPLMVGDIDGDGLPDVICPYDYGNGVTATYVQLNQGNAFSAWRTWRGIAPAGTLSLPSCKSLTAMDVNGDGLADLVCFYDYGNAVTATYVQLSQGTAFSAWQTWSAPTAPGGLDLNSCKPLMVGDINGDGLPDAICPYDYGNGVTATYVQLNQGSSFSAWRTWRAPTPATTLSLPNCKSLIAADVNGDGLVDLVCPYDYGNGMTATYVQLSQGDSFSAWQRWSAPTAAGGFDLPSCKPLTIGDVNGDGLPDLICAYDYGNGVSAAYVQLNRGSSFSPWETWRGPSPAGTLSLTSCKSPSLADVNGDGLLDLICPYDYGSNGSTTFVQFGRGGVRELLSKVSHSSQTDVSWSFQPITNNAVYTKDSDGVYPVQNLQYPFSVVSSVSVNNGVSGTTNTTYSYGGLKAEVGTGRGLLGFRWQKIRQEENGITSYSEFLQSWPYTGLVSITRKSIAVGGSSGVLSQTISTFACNDASATGAASCTVGAGKRYFVYAKQSVESSWDYNGAALPVITTSTEYDSWGNAVKVDVTTDDGFKKSTVNSYSNDSTNWYLGRLLKSGVTSTSP